ncbi:MAG: LysM peptidoglycan-binding domain-containing protein [Anaerolineae bacterium]|nr:LysM peptidoglycan-binding domain-containing protein [Anaerolineae bacterium]
MRKNLVISLILLSILLAACGGASQPVSESVDMNGVDGSMESALEVDAPSFEPTPTPPLPPTFTPSAMAHQGHLYLLPVSGADGSIQYAYKVRPGDNLSSISAMYGVSVQDVMIINDIADVNHIEVGELLIIPIEG